MKYTLRQWQLPIFLITAVAAEGDQANQKKDFDFSVDQISEAIFYGESPFLESVRNLEAYSDLRAMGDAAIPLLLDRITSSSVPEPYATQIFRDMLTKREIQPRSQGSSKKPRPKNLVLNNSFEQGIEQWHKISIETMVASSPVRIHGQTGLYLIRGGIFQEIDIEGGKDYMFSFMSLFQGHPLDWKGEVQLEWFVNQKWQIGVGQEMNFKNAERIGWYTLAVEDKSPAGASKVKLILKNSGSSIYPWLLDFVIGQKNG